MFAIVKKLIDGARNLLTRAIKACMLALIWVYQHGISPHLGANCRYQPTCSAYAREAIVRHGPLKGCFLAIKRIARCHPGYPGGHDPVP